MARRRGYLGSINLLGLNSLGQNPGMNPIFGTLIGGGVAGTTTVVLRRTSTTNHPEAFGLLAGLAASGAMYAMKSTRHAAIGAAVGAFLASGIAWLEKTLLGSVTIPAAAGTAGMGIPKLRTLNGLGIPQMRALNGLGLPAVANVPQPVGVAGSQLAAPGGGAPPVSLMGQPSAAAAHLLGIGGPPVHGLSTSYGATLLGGGR